MQDRTEVARAAIRAWSKDHPVDPSALTIDDLPAEMRTPEVREGLEAMPAERRAFVLWIAYAAATMTPEQLDAVGFTEAEL